MLYQRQKSPEVAPLVGWIRLIPGLWLAISVDPRSGYAKLVCGSYVVPVPKGHVDYILWHSPNRSKCLFKYLFGGLVGATVLGSHNGIDADLDLAKAVMNEVAIGVGDNRKP